MQAAAAHADQAADARRRPAVLAIADGTVHEVVDAGTDLPTADFAQALDRVSMQDTAAILDGRGVANTAQAPPPGPGVPATSPLGVLSGPIRNTAACFPWGVGGASLSASDVRASQIEARKAAEKDTEADRAAHRSRKEERFNQTNQ